MLIARDGSSSGSNDMVRSIVSVTVGYVVLAVVVMSCFLGLWVVLGVDGVLQPGTFKGKMSLNVGAVAASIVGALAGGIVCGLIAKKLTPVKVFAGIVLVLGLVAAAVGIQKPEPGERKPGLTVREALEQGREPDWYLIVNPLIGAAGVLAGGMLVQKKASV